jgi:hypothetical protein
MSAGSRSLATTSCSIGGEETEVLSADECHFDIGPLRCGPIQVSCGLHASEATPQNEDPRFVRAAACDTFARNWALMLVGFAHDRFSLLTR